METPSASHTAQTRHPDGGGGSGGKVQLGDESGENGDAHHGQSAYGEQHACRRSPMGRPPQGAEVLMAAGGPGQPRPGEEQHGLGDGVGHDLQQCRQQGGLRPHAQPHIDVADLCAGGVGDHGPQPPRLNGGNAAHYHAADAQHQQQVLNTAGGKDLDADDLIDDLDEQEDVPLGYHTRQDTGGGGRGPTVGVGHPEVEGKQAALNGKSAHHQTDGHGHGEAVGAVGPQQGNGLLQLREQQLTRNGVGEDDADEEQPGAHQ